MRLFVLATLTATTFVAAMAIEVIDANAVVYCRTVGVPRGCVVRPVAGPVVAAPVVVAPAARPVVYCKTRGVPKGCVMR